MAGCKSVWWGEGGWTSIGYYYLFSLNSVFPEIFDFFFFDLFYLIIVATSFYSRFASFRY